MLNKDNYIAIEEPRPNTRLFFKFAYNVVQFRTGMSGSGHSSVDRQI
jgi:hypothetical protein